MLQPNLILLTTKTDHHIYYINRIAQAFFVRAIFFEEDQIQPKFPVGPLFEEEQSLFEKEFFLKDKHR
jgi:hypothetical protein